MGAAWQRRHHSALWSGRGPPPACATAVHRGTTACIPPWYIDGNIADTGRSGEHPLVLPSRPHGLRKIVEAAFQVAHVSMSVRFEVDSYMLIKDLAERGLGCAILPRSSIRRPKRKGSSPQQHWSPPLRRQIVRALRPGPDPDRATEVALAVLDSIIAVRATAGDWKLFEPKH